MWPGDSDQREDEMSAEEISLGRHMQLCGIENASLHCYHWVPDDKDAARSVKF